MPIMKKGDILNYFGQSAEVVDFDKTHVVIKLVNGTIHIVIRVTQLFEY